MIARTLIAWTCLLLASPSALAWWNAEWSFRKKIVLNTSETGTPIRENLARFPIAVRLHTGNFTFLDAKEDGSDLRFVAGDDKTPLKHHVERFDPVNELAIVWVEVPRLAGGAAQETVWLYFGNPKAVATGDAKGMFDPNDLAVLHFGEREGAPRDATAYGNHVTQAAGSAAVPGVLGGGVLLDGTGRMSIPASPSLKVAPGGGFTFSAWVRPAEARDAILFAQAEGERAISVALDAGGRVIARVAGGAAPVEAAGGQVAPKQWAHVAVTLGKRLVVMVNAQEVAAADAAVPEVAGEVSLGAAADGSRAFAGEMDEVRISNVARSADWIRAGVASQGEGGRLVAFGQEEQTGSSGGHFAVLVGSLTTDAIVVIAILGVMLAISLVVMLAKFLALSRTDRANRVFMQRFAALGDDLAGLASDGKAPAGLGASSMYRIYQRGMAELLRRVATPAGDAVQGLTAKSLGAIRASLDATMVRESHRLNSQMVMLTISISGGPFLGLLGTVVGVMITFTGIAAAGDVNINAIAPGMAAALLATVAGLAVAIPCLFGYNYLATRIKSISADTQVFVEELMGRVAERHGA